MRYSKNQQDVSKPFLSKKKSVTYFNKMTCFNNQANVLCSMKISRGRIQGSLDVSVAVMSMNKKTYRIDLDTGDILYHVKVGLEPPSPCPPVPPSPSQNTSYLLGYSPLFTEPEVNNCFSVYYHVNTPKINKITLFAGMYLLLLATRDNAMKTIS